jgi:hypothetical protein
VVALADPVLRTGRSDRVPGFLTGYATAAVEEDKAETFAYMIVDPEYVLARSAWDQVVRTKADRMRAMVADFCVRLK